MASISEKDKLKFEQFKKEAKVINLTSKETGRKKQIIKWRDKTFQIADFHTVFRLIKNEI